MVFLVWLSRDLFHSCFTWFAHCIAQNGIYVYSLVITWSLAMAATTPGKNPIWNYFNIDSDDDSIAICNICGTNISRGNKETEEQNRSWQCEHAAILKQEYSTNKETINVSM